MKKSNTSIAKFAPTAIRNPQTVTGGQAPKHPGHFTGNDHPQHPGNEKERERRIDG
jgi:hypothetical protein